MLLTGPEIMRLASRYADGVVPTIRIDPFDPELIGPNSLDVRLGGQLLVYDEHELRGSPLDPKKRNPTRTHNLCVNRWLLEPGVLYLGYTLERVGAWGLVPKLETKSSVARLGVSTHLSAGFGDDGFDAQWTLEITVVRPVWLYPGMRIAQIEFAMLTGVRMPYKGKYQGDVGPVPSRSWQEDKL